MIDPALYAARSRMSAATEAPTLRTQRLTLRPHRLSDLAAFGAFRESRRAAYVMQPDNVTQLWHSFSSEVGSWTLQGHGGWAIDLGSEFIGQVAIIHPPNFPEAELGWIIFDDQHEGKGYAHEAARAALDWAWAESGFASLVSYIDRRNTRSIALAERLGGTEDPQAAVFDEADAVYRHRRPA
ncbi:MAG: GNAT family N-acetyltransferase [Pseudomonadota bacterium]